jgi:hypothetical protein
MRQRYNLAVENRDVEGVRSILDEGVSLAEAVSPWGWPLVHVAALRGHLETAKLLVGTRQHNDRRTLKPRLRFALQSGNREVVRYFLDQGRGRHTGDTAASISGTWRAGPLPGGGDGVDAPDGDGQLASRCCRHEAA